MFIPTHLEWDFCYPLIRMPQGLSDTARFDCRIINMAMDKKNNREIVKDFLVVTKQFHRKFTKMEVKLDTGAQTNVLPLSVYKTLFPPSHKLQEPAKPTAYGGPISPQKDHAHCTFVTNASCLQYVF
jgi:hypothetical protein